jgi:uncharacterized phage protein (TIGR02218 family)
MNIYQKISNLENFVYLIEVQCAHITLFLTSGNEDLIIGNKLYKAKSGLQIDSIILGSNIQNSIKIRGFYEDGGIAKNIKLTNSIFKIGCYFTLGNTYYSWFEMELESIASSNVEFQIILKNKQLDFNLHSHFSKNCRASFGDSMCKIDKKSYIYRYEVQKIESNIIHLVSCDKYNGFFNNSDCVMNNKRYKVLSHTDMTLILSEDITEIDIHFVDLELNCDKKFVTCCNIYNNAVNFRGEPACAAH